MKLAACAVLTAACAAPEPADPGVFEFEPGLLVPLGPYDLKADLPNSAFYPRPLDTSGYRAIAQRYVAANMDVTLPQGVVAEYDWPLADSQAVLGRQGTPIRLASYVYEHTGLDIIRNDEMESAAVHAPTTGTALITDWWGGESNPQYDYSTVISIWDPDTHHVLQLMHVKPDPMLPRSGFFQVQRGQVIGELADISIPGGRHTHVNVIDAEHFELLDPVRFIPAYPDMTKPVIGEVYLLDEMARKYQTLKDGALDLVVTAHDRDDQSPRNLEVASLAFVAKDQLGNIVGELERCHLSDAFKKLATDWSVSTTTIRLIDFGNATGQFSGFWPSSDLGNPARLFRYALTNLKLDAGQCSVVANDRDGQLTIAPEVEQLTITIEVWDARDNHETQEITLAR